MRFLKVSVSSRKLETWRQRKTTTWNTNIEDFEKPQSPLSNRFENPRTAFANEPNVPTLFEGFFNLLDIFFKNVESFEENIFRIHLTE